MATLWEQLDSALSWNKGSTLWAGPNLSFSSAEKDQVEKETELEEENALLLKSLAEATVNQVEKGNDQKQVGLWKVEGFTDDELAHVYPKSSVTDVEVRKCAGIAETMTVYVHGMCNSLKVEHCTNVRVLCDDVIERVDVSHCQKLELVLGGRNRTMVLSHCHLVLVTASHLMFQDPGVETTQCTQVQCRWTTNRPGRTMTAEELLSAPLDGMVMVPEAISTSYKDYAWTSHCKVPPASRSLGKWEVRPAAPAPAVVRASRPIFSAPQQPVKSEQAPESKPLAPSGPPPSAAPLPAPAPAPAPAPYQAPAPPQLAQQPPPTVSAVPPTATAPHDPPAEGYGGGEGGGLREEGVAWTWFEYAAGNADELSFGAGERLQLLAQAEDPGWFHAENSAQQRGLVPITHLRLGDAETSLSFQAVRTAAFDYDAEHIDELSFKAGEEIGIVSVSVDEGWFHASVNGKRGLVPSTHLVPRSDDPAPPELHAGQPQIPP